MPLSPISENLRAARRQLRLSQTEAAKFIHITRQSLAAFERGVRQPDLNHLLGLSNLYRLTPDELIGRVRSAVRPEDAPSFHARLNSLKEVSDFDRHELVSFDDYLQRRTRAVARPDFKLQPFDSIEVVVARLTKKELLDTTPIPIFALLARYGIEVRFTALNELAGALLIADKDRPDGVIINSDQPYDRQRFSAAHELGHLILKHECPKAGAFVSHLGRRFDATEVHADQFASELLVPAPLLRERIKELPNAEPLAESVYRLAAAFLVSFQAMTLRLGRLGALKPEQRESLEKIKPGELAKRLAIPVRGERFRRSWLPSIAREFLPSDWFRRAGPDTVRLLQETAYTHYIARVSEGAAIDSASIVYQQTALWVANTYPIVSR